MAPTSLRTPFVALAALALLAAGCGDDDGAAPTTTTSAPAEATGGDAESGDDAEERGEPSDVTADDLLAAVDETKAAGSAAVQIDAAFDGGAAFGSQELSLGGPVTFDGTRGDITLEVSGSEGAMRIVLADGSAWVGGDLDQVRDALPDGADWAQLPLEELLASPGFSNPGDLAYLYLVGGATDVREDGDALRFDIDLEAAVGSAPEELRDEVASTVSFTGEQDPDVTGAVVLDDEGRVTSLSVVGVQRPTAEEADQLSIGEDEELRVTLDVALDGFGQPVEASVPEGDAVPIAEAPDLAALLGISSS